MISKCHWNRSHPTSKDAYPYLDKFLEKLGHGRRRDASLMLSYLEPNQ